MLQIELVYALKKYRYCCVFCNRHDPSYIAKSIVYNTAARSVVGSSKLLHRSEFVVMACVVPLLFSCGVVCFGLLTLRFVVCFWIN